MNSDISAVVDAAATWVFTHDRAQYADIFVALEHACVTAGARITGGVGIAMLTGSAMNHTLHTYEIFISGGYAGAKRILDAVCGAAGTKHVITLDTDIKDVEFVISADGRMVARLLSCGHSDDPTILAAMTPISRRGYYIDEEIFVAPEEIAIMSQLRTLYTPALIGDATAALDYVMRLYAAMRDDLTTRILGGASNTRGTERRPVLIGDARSIIIGDHALVAQKLMPATNRHVQIICDIPIDEIRRRVAREVGRDCRAVKHHINLPGDFQLTKWTIYALTGGHRDGKSQKPVMDVFNSTEYELVPMLRARDGTRTGAEWVLLRFMFLDLWLMKRVLREAAAEKRPRVENIIRGIVAAIAIVFTRINEIIARGDIIELFPADETMYLGTSVSSRVAKKKLKPYGRSITCA